MMHARSIGALVRPISLLVLALWAISPMGLLPRDALAAETAKSDAAKADAAKPGTASKSNAAPEYVDWSRDLKDGVVVRDVTFKSRGLTLAGDLYLPPNFDERAKYGAIVSVHPAGSVKEQTAGLYARKLAKKGLVALAFDSAHVGESEGEPRYVEDPFARMEDIHAAIDYLVTLDFVDEDRIAALGVCAGGGYVMAVTPTERRIKAAVGVSTADIGSSNRDGWLGGATIESQIAKLDAVAAQRTKEARGAEPLVHPIMPDSLDEDTAHALTNPALKDLVDKGDVKATFPASFIEAYDYYRTPRGWHPRSTNRMLMVSGDKKMLFSAVNATTRLFTRPALFVVGSKSDARRFTDDIFNAIPGEAKENKKEIFVLEGASHVDLYDRPQYVDPAVDKIADFVVKAFESENAK